MTALPLAALPELRDTRVLRIVGGKDVEAVAPERLPSRVLPAAPARPAARPLPVAQVKALPVTAAAGALKAVVGWALAAALAMGAAAGVASALNPPVAASDAVVTVAAGESLWTIAEAHAGTTSTRDYVAALIAVNELSSSTIVQGQALTLPKLP